MRQQATSLWRPASAASRYTRSGANVRCAPHTHTAAARKERQRLDCNWLYRNGSFKTPDRYLAPQTCSRCGKHLDAGSAWVCAAAGTAGRACKRTAGCGRAKAVLAPEMSLTRRLRSERHFRVCRQLMCLFVCAFMHECLREDL